MRTRGILKRTSLVLGAVTGLGLGLLAGPASAHITPPQGGSARSSLSGDGRAELVSVNADGSLTAFPNVDGINFHWGEGRTVGTGWNPYRTRFADLDGDGRKELISVNANGQIVAFPNTDGMNAGWGTPRVIGDGWYNPERTQFADLNGDGRAELLSLGANGEITAFPNVDGLHYNWGTPRVVGSGWNDPARVRLADLDGNGRAELISVNGNGEISAFPNLDGLNGSWGNARVIGSGWDHPSRTRVADLDGDGRAELISVNGNGEISAFPNVDGLNGNWGGVRTVGSGWWNPDATLLA
ncbi:FG-GAP repeat domain-containing protein [Streptomyces sp. NPDC048603]|uniref:FG-GAP repeat domain-containing protein n=1 Tax=Streptomyces sp. NPDC048603 TaxID=3365577 RepID=UPI00371AC93C